MKLLFFIVCISPLWLDGCGKYSRKIGDNEFVARWSPIIAFLNQDGASKKTALEEDDLHQLYKQECAFIEARWKQMPHENVDKKEVLKKKNIFFSYEISKLNDEAFQALLKEEAAQANVPRDYDALAATILRKVFEHPIASLSKVEAYGDGMEIGFCFGRALLVHYLLLKAGIAPHDIFKVFALGDFKVSGQFWHFHVAVMIKTPDKGFIVIDPLYPEAQSYGQWQKEVSRLEIKHPFSRARFYSTDARKFMPHSDRYTQSALREPPIKSYFYDLSKSLK